MQFTDVLTKSDAIKIQLTKYIYTMGVYQHVEDDGKYLVIYYRYVLTISICKFWLMMQIYLYCWCTLYGVINHLHIF